MTQHTPGPFVLAPAKAHSLIQWDFQDGIPRRSLQVETEIAVLWAQAPAMLEALKALVTAVEHRDNTMGDPCRLIECKANLERAAREARAVIAEIT